MMAMAWTPVAQGFTITAPLCTATVVPHPFALRVATPGGDIATSDGEAYPTAAIAMRYGGQWRSPRAMPTVTPRGNHLHYWGSDIGGYFNVTDDEVFTRWAQFAALTPIMETHGLGIREPWLFQPATLDIYRRYANLHACLTPYSRMAAQMQTQSGMPLMRAMALAFPGDPTVHQDWIQYSVPLRAGPARRPGLRMEQDAPGLLPDGHMD